MPLLHIVILALVQGISEFLPVSSSGHLVLLPHLAGWRDQGLNIDIAVHVGTLGAVLVYFWRDIWAILAGFMGGKRRQRRAGRALGIHLLISLPPVIVAGGLLVYFAPDMFRSPLIVAWTMLGFGALLWLADRVGMTVRRVEHMTAGSAFIIGMAQILALVPGTSRSGITMTAARFLGFERAAAARFSMLMSIPVIVAAAAVAARDLAQSGEPILNGDAGLAAGLAFLTALLSIAILMAMLKRMSFAPFVAYRMFLGVVLLVLYYSFGWTLGG
ncbi:MAG: undecaprenyl-diphosphate phosphatase [Alphaproteobacteria bacterium]|nr:undecaprenyl-diphosphate phosphatase [Alphaproteobacteria bacterium]